MGVISVHMRSWLVTLEQQNCPKTSLGKIKTQHSSQTMIFPRLTANFITQELLTMTSYAQKSLPYFYSGLG